MNFENAVANYESGNLGAAWEACIQALDENQPDHRLLHLMGLIAFRQNRLEEASSCFARAVEMAPGEARYLCDRALPFFARDDFESGLEAVDRALKLNPDFMLAADRKAAALMQLNRSREALPLLEVLATKEPSPRRIMSLALCLRSLGKLHEARSHLETMLAGHKTCGQGWWLLAGLSRAEPERNHVAAMESALVDTKAAHDKVPLLFALAKEYEDLDEFDKAFEFYAEANALRRRGLEYDIEADAALFRRIMTRSETRVPLRQASATNEATPIFVVSMPRTGSTLVERILGAHSKVCAAGELQLVGRLVRGISARTGRPYPDSLDAIEESDLEDMREAYFARSRQWRDGSPFFVDKMPINFLYLGLMAEIFPSAFFIHVYRDPVDTCLSCYRQLFGDYYRFSYDLGELGRWYGMYRELMAHWQRDMPERIINVAYEELVADPEGQARSLLSLCGLEWEPGCLDFTSGGAAVRTPSAEQVRRRVYQDSVGRWRRYESHLAPLLQALGRHAEA